MKAPTSALETSFSAGRDMGINTPAFLIRVEEEG
jgi:hypothetical protein